MSKTITVTIELGPRDLAETTPEGLAELRAAANLLEELSKYLWNREAAYTRSATWARDRAAGAMGIAGQRAVDTARTVQALHDARPAGTAALVGVDLDEGVR